MQPGADGFPGPTWQKTIDYQLYNLDEDIEEQNNVVDKYPEIVEKLKKIGEKARHELGDRLTGIKGNENREPGRIGESRVKFENHLAVGKNIQLSTNPNSKYGKGESKIISDGWLGSLDYNDGKWLGFEEVDFEAIIDLTEIRNVNKISASFLQNQSSWIFLPKSVNVKISKDDNSYIDIKSIHNKIEPSFNIDAKIFEFGLNNLSSRFLKISAKNIKVCPDWHSGKGGKAWLFIDEIIIK
jgi:hypothetical protein